jgi:hypothetical protein
MALITSQIFCSKMALIILLLSRDDVDQSSFPLRDGAGVYQPDLC